LSEKEAGSPTCTRSPARQRADVLRTALAEAPHGEPLELEKTDEQLLRETEEACRKDPGFMLVSEWERLMSQRLENDKAR
jgi:hypothetical protein